MTAPDPAAGRTGPQLLVVGAGPVGLSAAHELARHRVAVRLVDAARGPATTRRALATHARTLETYNQMGVLDELLPRGQRVEHFTLHRGGRRLVRFDTDHSRLTRSPNTPAVPSARPWSTRASRTRSPHTAPAWASTSRSSNTTRRTAGSSRSRNTGGSNRPSGS